MDSNDAVSPDQLAHATRAEHADHADHADESAITAPGFHQFDRGAHVTAWHPAGQEHPVLWSSSLARIGEGQAWRGGIPICAPWFATGPDGERRPSHGPVRTARWQRIGVSDEGTRHELAVDVDATGEPASLTLEVETRRGDASLHVRLSVTNTGPASALVEAALHTYLAVSDVTGVRVRGLEPVPYFDKATGDARPAETPLEFGELVDRVYDDGGSVIEVVDEEWSRFVRVERRGASKAVVWNPGPDHAPGDVGPGAWRDFVCVEAAAITDPATPGVGPVTLGAGATHRLETILTVLPLDAGQHGGDSGR